MVYEKLNLRLTRETIHYRIPRFCTTADLSGGLHNDLETVTLSLHPVLQRMKDLLVEFGALGALMSGSGPTVFGAFAEEKAAQAAAEGLKEAGAGNWSVFLAHSLT
jgi:4-diphosphocytidyl-2-C-methyl-D-erythritol kinase